MTENGTQTLELADCVSLHFAEHSGHSLAFPAADCDFIFYCWVSDLLTHNNLQSIPIYVFFAFQNTHHNISETSRTRATHDLWLIGKFDDQ